MSVENKTIAIKNPVGMTCRSNPAFLYKLLKISRYLRDFWEAGDVFSTDMSSLLGLATPKLKFSPPFDNRTMIFSEYSTFLTPPLTGRQQKMMRSLTIQLYDLCGLVMCRRHSSVCERALHRAGNIRPLANECCTVQETFVRLRMSAAPCRRHSSVCE
jgi:hypothetical protein